MLDFLKLTTFCTQTIEYLKDHYLLQWIETKDRLNRFDMEVISTKTVKQYKGIYFFFYSNRVDIMIKPHYYFNENVHNANDFKANDCIKVLEDVRSTLNIDLMALKVVNIEYGINAISPICVKQLISFIQYHDRNEFKTDHGLAYSKKSFKPASNGGMNLYKIIKFYSKGDQFLNYCNKDTFRFEIKSKKSKYINSLGIYTADDLLNFSVYERLGNEIAKEFDSILLLDCDTDFSSLKAIEQKKVSNYLSTLTWFKISQDTYKDRFNKERAKYYILINKVPNNLKNRLIKIVFDKIQHLKTGEASHSKTTKQVNSQKMKTGEPLHIYKGRTFSTLDKSNTIVPLKPKESKIIDLSYRGQKEAIREYNRLAVLKYNL